MGYINIYTVTYSVWVIVMTERKSQSISSPFLVLSQCLLEMMTVEAWNASASILLEMGKNLWIPMKFLVTAHVQALIFTDEEHFCLIFINYILDHHFGTVLMVNPNRIVALRVAFCPSLCWKFVNWWIGNAFGKEY